LPGDFVVYDELMAVRGEGEKDVEAAAHGVGLGLLEPVRRWQMLGLRLEESDRYGLAGRVDLDSERVVNATLWPPAGTLTNHLDRAGRLLATDQILGPAAGVERGVDQLRSSVGFTERHASRSMVYGQKSRDGHEYDPVNIRPRRRNDAGAQTNREQMEAFEVRGA